MDKICIVKLRKNMTNPATLGQEVSLMLTPEQMRVLQSNPDLPAFFNGAAAAKGVAAAKQLDETIVFKFAFEPAPPVRLLKMEEVVHMLRISKGYLRKIIRQGELKSYKLGRLRRIKFDDVLSYLEGSQEFIDIRQRAAEAKQSRSGSV